jgi:hypothetical protein
MSSLRLPPIEPRKTDPPAWMQSDAILPSPQDRDPHDAAPAPVRIEQGQQPSAPASKSATTHKGIWIALAAAVVLGLWSTDRLDPMLVNVGLNHSDCVQNGFGATFCGDAAKRYQQNIAQLQSQLGSP